MSAATANVELQQAAVRQHCKLLRMPPVSTQFDTTIYGETPLAQKAANT